MALRRLSRVRAVAALLLTATPLASQGQEGWRFWTIADGLAESFSEQISIGPDGRAWIRHGRVESVTVLDGYSAIGVRAPKNLGQSFWTIGRDSLISNDDAGNLMEYSGQKWISHKVNSNGTLPLGGRRVLVMQADVLSEYDLDSRTQRVIRRAQDTHLGRFLVLCCAGDPGGFWVLGETGVARARPDASSWTEYPFASLGLKNAEQPYQRDDGSLYVVATRKSDESKVLARLNGQRWEIPHGGNPGVIRGWPGTAGTLWLQDPGGLHHLVGEHIDIQDRNGVLSGAILNVVAEPGGTIWVGTNQGLARLAPSLWQTPREVANVRTGVQSAYEDSDGSLWFLSSTGLWRLSGETWQEYPFPAKWSSITQGTEVVPGPGGVLLLTVVTSRGNSLLVFDPRHPGFREVPAPAGQFLQRVLPRDAGSAWICTRINATRQFLLHIFDGQEYHEFLRLPVEWNLGVVRAIHQMPNGDMLVGGSGGLALYSHGQGRKIGPTEGFTDNASFRLCPMADGSVLAGGRQKLLRYNGKSWTVIRDGMDTVRDMLQARDGTVWVASGSGVHRWRNGVWITNDENDGLPSSMAYAVVEDRRGRLWAGTTAGISQFHGEADADPPRTFLSAADNQSKVPPDGRARIVFSGADKWKITAADRLLFSHRLDGAPWSPFATGNSISFSALKAGGHRFEVRAMDRNGNVDPTPAGFDFVVLVPWFKEVPFLGILGLSAVSILGLMALAMFHYRARGRMIVQLRRAQQSAETALQAAEAASRAKSSFLANMSHEIRTPMNGVMGMTALALETALTPEQQQYLTAANASAQSLLSILNDILDFSKVEAGKMELCATDFRLRDCIADALQTVAVRAAEKGLELTYRISPEVPEALNGDAGRLRQVIVNLVGNAVKFTAAGEIAVVVEFEDKDGRVVLHVRVADTGVGVPPEKQKSIFEPFEQADSSTTRKYGGTGLGLTICSRLVTLMGGRIWLESPRTDVPAGPGGPGSIFHFTVQCARSTAVAAQPPVTLPDGIRCLVAVETSSRRANLAEVLTAWGLRTEALGDAAAVIPALQDAAAAGHAFSLVFLDLHAPKADSFAVAQRIRQDAGLRTTRIVVLTSPVSSGDRDTGVAAAADAVLLKPLNLSRLRATVASLLKSNGGPLQSREAHHAASRAWHILLAEDNKVNQLVARRLLEKRGHSVTVVDNGRAAVSSAQTGAFDLVLMDVQMPEMDGLEATVEIRKLETNGQRLPIVAMTAHTMKGDRERCLESGMDGYVFKPVQPDELDRAIAEVMQPAAR
jgi:signal transduction histidine kinase/DNA-binding response OmpR family regulator